MRMPTNFPSFPTLSSFVTRRRIPSCKGPVSVVLVQGFPSRAAVLSSACHVVAVLVVINVCTQNPPCNAAPSWRLPYATLWLDGRQVVDCVQTGRMRPAYQCIRQPANQQSLSLAKMTGLFPQNDRLGLHHFTLCITVVENTLPCSR